MAAATVTYLLLHGEQHGSGAAVYWSTYMVRSCQEGEHAEAETNEQSSFQCFVWDCWPYRTLACARLSDACMYAVWVFDLLATLPQHGLCTIQCADICISSYAGLHAMASSLSWQHSCQHSAFHSCSCHGLVDHAPVQLHSKQPCVGLVAHV
mmetsp:Transcript_12375/g.26728  ORF Transcript_12375/g.26728 Transcript_12375/m.26728 type:complete len:152 (-) Transcript_12375:170-625(-)